MIADPWPRRLRLTRPDGAEQATTYSPPAVTTFPGGIRQPPTLTISKGDAFGLVDVTASGIVDINGGDVEFLDVAGQGEVTITGGAVHFLESAGCSTVTVLGGHVEFLTLVDTATVRVFGTDLRVIGDCLTGRLADGSPVNIQLTGEIHSSLYLFPLPWAGAVDTCRRGTGVLRGACARPPCSKRVG